MSVNHNLMFIFTEDENIKNELLNLNYSLIKKMSNFFVFKNKFENKELFKKLENNNLDISKLLFTNKMYF